MSTLTATPPVFTPRVSQLSDELAPFPVLRWTVAQYRQLIADGYFGDARVELLRGWLVETMTHNPAHAWVVRQLNPILCRLVPQAWVVQVQLAVSLYDSEPEPDLAIVRATSDYCEHHPTTGEIGLVVEVADTSLSRDRLKESIYAQADLPTYWIVDLKRRQVEVHTSPDVAGRRYQEVRVVREDEKIPVILDGQSIGEIAVADFLPPVA